MKPKWNSKMRWNYHSLQRKILDDNELREYEAYKMALNYRVMTLCGGWKE